ncbi:hypothetical protein LSUE1_G008074, partial [Lachnellula suecica]
MKEISNTLNHISSPPNIISPTRDRFTDDILADLSPSSALEAFTSPSGKLRASVEAASQSERAFGVRATRASQKIQEWVDELSGWSWPSDGGFELPAAKRRRISDEANGGRHTEETGYTGGIPTADFLHYEVRVEEIQEDMEDLDLEEIKRHVLDTHTGTTRPSSAASTASVPQFLSSYTLLEDFTAMVTKIVLQALPNLSRLNRLLDIWSIRLSVLRKIPPLLSGLEDTEIALKSGWQAISVPENQHTSHGQDAPVLSRETFEVMRDVLHGKVSSVGQDVDYMLDALEGTPDDILPDSWPTRMDFIEENYAEWVVAADRKVQEGEWKREAADRKLKEAAAAEAARLKAEREAQEAKELEEERTAERARRKAEEDAENLRRLEHERTEKAEREKAEEEAENARRWEAEQAAEEARLKAETDAENSRRLQEEEAAEFARRKAQQDAEDTKKLEEQQALEIARLKAEKNAEAARKLQEEEAAELARQKAQQDADDANKLEEQQVLETARLEAEKDAENSRILREEAEEMALQKTQQEADDAKRLAEQQALEATRLKAEKEAEATEATQRQALKDAQGSETIGEQAAADVPQQSEPVHLDTAVAEKQVESNILPEIVEKDEQLDQKHISPALETGATAAVANPPVDIVLPSNLSPPCCDLSPETEMVATFDGSPDPHASPSAFLPHDHLPETTAGGQPVSQEKESKGPRPNNIIIPSAAGHSKVAQPLLTPSPSGRDIAQSYQLPKESTPDNRIRGRPSTPKSISRFGHPLSNLLRGSPSSTTPTEEHPRASPSLMKALASNNDRESCEDVDHIPTPSNPSTPAAIPVARESSQQDVSNEPSKDGEWNFVPYSADDTKDGESGSEVSVPTEPKNDVVLDAEDTKTTKGHSRNISRDSLVSAVSGYATSEPSPEIQHAEPAGYFRPVLSPIKSPDFSAEFDEPRTPTGARFIHRKSIGSEAFPELDERDSIPSFGSQTLPANHVSDESSISSAPEINDLADANTEDGHDDSMGDFEPSDVSTPVIARRASATVINTGVRRISLSRPQSSASDTPTIVDNAGTPVIPSSPIGGDLEAFLEIETESPTAGRIGLRNDTSYNFSPPGSPSMIPRPEKLHVRTPSSPTFPISEEISDPSDTSSMSMDAPVFDNVDMMNASMISSPTRGSNDQLQQQISSILESIPTRIRLTSEPDAHQTDTLRPKKVRRSVTPSLRSHSSLSNYSRASTPSFLLSPAYSQTKSRPKPSNGNPEIKLYHLSRSTGEAPIKLFVRLIGEHGERVMVRVGGGWADLGEYLKEYASHHGRRTVADNDKVEIQDLPPRIVSTGSTTSTIRGNGRSSPAPGSRPASAFGFD